MKLIYIANLRIPTKRAHGIQVMKMAEAFAKQGAAVELLVPRRLFEVGDDSFQYHQVQKIFQIKKFFNLDTLQLPLGRIGFWITTLSFLLPVKFYLLFKKYDLIYTREPLGGVLFSNFILEIHHLPERIGFFYGFLLKRARSIVVITNSLKKELTGFGVPENKILVFPDSVDFSEFNKDISKEEARRKLELPLDKKIVVYTGSFSIYNWKGLDTLLESAKQLSNDYLLVCVGAHNEAEMGQLKRQYPFANILLKYFVPHQSVVWYLKAADVLALPNKAGNTISEFHTSPLKLFEYMASNRPVISSNLPSLREILTDDDAIFFKPGDVQDLAKAISRLASDEKLQKQLSQNAYFKVNQYTWEKRADKIIKWISA